MNIRVYVNKIINNGGKTLAMLTLTLNEEFTVRNIRIIRGKSGRFVAMPKFSDSYGNFNDVCYTRSKELKTRIEEAVLAAYDEEVAKTETPDE